MTRLDARKRTEWLKRLEDFEASGLTVVEFCRRTDVAPHTFYYWNARLRRTAGESGRRPVRQRGGKTCGEPPRTTVAVSASTATVHFAWGTALRVSVPADCVDAIRCVLQCASRAGRDAGESTKSFHEVVLAE